jgi:hypothetical protein
MDADPGPASASTALGSKSELDAVIPPFYRKAKGIKSDLAVTDGFHGDTLHSL